MLDVARCPSCRQPGTASGSMPEHLFSPPNTRGREIRRAPPAGGNDLRPGPFCQVRNIEAKS
jgi:hypothetical protein